MSSLAIFLTIAGSVYLIWLRPYLDRKREQELFARSVLSFIDGLYIAGIAFSCTADEMRNHARSLLEKADKLPGNQHLLQHTTESGFTYKSFTGSGDHMLFALLCVIDYAKLYSNDKLLQWCESELESSRKAAIGYR
jgi:hypothetical protein